MASEVRKLRFPGNGWFFTVWCAATVTFVSYSGAWWLDPIPVLALGFVWVIECRTCYEDGEARYRPPDLRDGQPFDEQGRPVTYL